MLESIPVDLCCLIEFTPHLRCLNGNSFFFCSKPTQTHPSIISLKLDYPEHKLSLITLLQQTPNLSYLTIKTQFICMNGNDWKKIFLDYLPNIKVFRLQMTNIFCRVKNKEEVIDELLDSFRTEFWLEEHQWFVRCDWSPLINNTSALLYTLPYTFDEYLYSEPLCSKSTVPNDRTYWLYDRVHSLQYFYVRRPTNDLYLFRGIFPNIRALSIHIPLIDDLWSRIPILHHLKSLDVVFIRGGDLVYSQLQTLFDRANHLYSLTIGINASVQVDFSKLKSTSIHQLSFLYKMLIYTQSFDSRNCTTLACSPLGLQCKILSIEVNNYTTVLHLIKQMPNLQSLTFRIKNIDEKSAYDELAIRLRTDLPSAHAFTRKMGSQYTIEILMDR